MTLLKLQRAVVAALEDVKARDISVFNVQHLTSMFDRVVIATGESSRQVKALGRSVQDKVKAIGRQDMITEVLVPSESVVEMKKGVKKTTGRNLCTHHQIMESRRQS